MSELLYAIGTLVSAAAAVLAWVAKLKWSKEFRDAKDATIQAKEDQIKTLQARHEASAAENDAVLKAKDALIAAKDEQVKLLQTEITNLREFSPSKLREYFLTVRQQLEEYNNLLKSQLEEAQNVIKQKQDEINAVKSEGAAQSEAVKRLEKEKAVIEENTKKLQEKVGALEATERPAVFTFDPKILEEIRISSKTLQKSLPDSMPEIKIDDLSKSLQKNLTKFDWKKFDLSKVLFTEIEDKA